MREFREFLEKRWWQGIGGIAGIIAIVIGILKWQGIGISGLAVSITLNIIFVAALVIIAIWATKWKRKCEVASSRLGELQRLVGETIEAIKAQKKVTGLKRVLLPDPNNISKLNVDNDLLNELYGQAYSRAVSKYHDAKLSGFAILVDPYSDDRVSIHFDFHSQWAGRECTFMIGEIGDMQESLPNEPVEREATFDELPWIQEPNWLQFLKKSCERAGPLSPARWSGYILSADAGRDPQWWIYFSDGVTGKKSRFDWDGIGEPIPRGEFG